MVKRGKLSKVEQFYIEGHADLSAEDLATELDRSINIVQKHLDTMPEPTKTTEQPKPDTEEEPRMFQVMGRHERAGEKVATVMTQSASQFADETRPKRTMNKKLQEAIHKPFKNRK